jgi:Uma2 family endonuclease
MSTTPPRATQFTYADLLRLPEDGLRHEIIDGEHVVNASPNLYHQDVSKRLVFELMVQVEITGRGKVYPAPTDVYFTETNVLVPDILVVVAANRAVLGTAKVEGAPDLVVEILSPSTERNDRKAKLALYRRHGVREYWIVDPDEKVVEQRVLERGEYRLLGRHAASVRLAILPDVAIDLQRVW